MGKKSCIPKKDAGVENVNRKFRQNNQFYHFYQRDVVNWPWAARLVYPRKEIEENFAKSQRDSPTSGKNLTSCLGIRPEIRDFPGSDTPGMSVAPPSNNTEIFTNIGNILTRWSVAEKESNNEKNWRLKISLDCLFKVTVSREGPEIVAKGPKDQRTANRVLYFSQSVTLWIV